MFSHGGPNRRPTCTHVTIELVDTGMKCEVEPLITPEVFVVSNLFDKLFFCFFLVLKNNSHHQIIHPKCIVVMFFQHFQFLPSSPLIIPFLFSFTLVLIRFD